MIKLKPLYLQIIIALVGLLVFVPFLGGTHLFDWDEINFAESAREMLASGNFLTVQIDYKPFWEKPPLFIWMQALSMMAFGVNEFAARFPNAICGVVTLLVIFNVGRKQYDTKFGLLWVLSYIGSILPFVYFKSGIIDPWFNLFIFLGIYFFVLYSNKEKSTSRKKEIILSGVFIGLAVFTKGPVALLIFGLTGFVFLLINRFKLNATFIDILLWIFVAALVGSLWFIIQILSGNSQMVVDFIVYQIRLFSTEDAGHGGFIGYHFVILLLGVFPASVFALKSFQKNSADTESQKHMKRWMLVLFWTVLILFSIVKTKIVHYSSLCYFPLTFLSAYVLYKITEGQIKFAKWQKALLVFVAIIWAAAVTALPIIDSHKQEIINSGIIKDAFAMGNLQANVHWNMFDYCIGILLLFGIISSFFIKNKTYQIIGVFLSVFIFINLAVYCTVGKVEQYSQNAAIEFYQNHETEDCYIRTFGFKSYAQLFYSKKQIPKNPSSYDEGWLLNGNIDKPVYFVVKIQNVSEFSQAYPKMNKQYEKNGFVFYSRTPN